MRRKLPRDCGALLFLAGGVLDLTGGVGSLKVNDWLEAGGALLGPG